MSSRSSPVWLFDLDNTLHNASHAIFPAITANMNGYIAQVLAASGAPADAEAVNAARLGYWRRYGATLLGMIHHHGVRAEDFLREAHRFDDLTQMIRAERGLQRLLERLPGRKILLTNAPRGYSSQVLRHLGLHRHFAAHVPIEQMRVHGRLRPKPSRALLKKLLAREGIRASRCVLVEDTVHHLKGAKTLGMRTVWITQYLQRQAARAQHSMPHAQQRFSLRPGYVDVKLKSVLGLPRRMAKLRTGDRS
ncbi:pyrimidine 5'-nucleotidase [Noviherbaspirillum pedocola]|uniref:Pyrimidine 5'-nucleotidase n=1 Tax=Noviherbaspirillum pedocola TaxID=2801341 RepID=A0A934STS4_9BURK|nr:pyrimidine 5'-nucleotidase [Noviherbaspirillum pedocola]MBK4736455.1 pyrimidine 5'-nucleotidase [Noviherbaspirillum pedocola]